MRSKETIQANIIQNGIITPDGTVMISTHRHDYIEHKDAKNGFEYMVDGGKAYIRRNLVTPLEDITLHSDDTFEEIREKLMRGTRGENMDEEFRYVRLKDINDAWLLKLIQYEQENRPDNVYLPYYIKEREFRKL